MQLVGIVWFLWATVWPLNVGYYEKDIRTSQVRSFTTPQACEKALAEYRKAVEKATNHDSVWVELVCSPVYPR